MFDPSSERELHPLDSLLIERNATANGTSVTLLLQDLRAFSHFQIKIRCIIAILETEVLRVVYLTTPGDRPPPPQTVEIPPGQITTGSLLMNVDLPRTPVGVIDHILVEVINNHTNEVATVVYTNGFSMAACLDRYDNNTPRFSFYIQE